MTDTEVKTIDEPTGDLIFSLATREVLRFTPDGDILHEGRLVKNAAKHVYKGLIQWLTAQEQIYPVVYAEIKRLTDENDSLKAELSAYKDALRSEPTHACEDVHE